MYIKKLQLQNFKRFTDLIIDLCPNDEEAPKLVLLIGQNGCGKSSVFDAFSYFNLTKEISNFNYYLKVANRLEQCSINIVLNEINDNWHDKYYDFRIPANSHYVDEACLVLGDSSKQLPLNTFYGRNSIKTAPTLELPLGTNFAENVENNLDAPELLIDRDERVKSNFAFYNNRLETFRNQPENGDKTRNEIDVLFHKEFRQGLENIFDYSSSEGGNKIRLQFSDIISSKIQGKADDFWFKKGDVSVEYEMLSMGEKQVIDTLLDIIMRKKFYTDSIVYFDELDLHLHTDLQYGLLREIMRLLKPLNSQVWVASHSLGFIQYARESEIKDSIKSAIIDFGSKNFDEKQTLKPSKTIDVFDIAIPKNVLKTVFSGKTIIFCENTDANYYNLAGIKDTIFIGAKDKYEVLARCKEGYFGIIDRDYLETAEFELMKKTYLNLHILYYYTFENYLYHPDNIKEVVQDFDIEDYKIQITEEKNASLLDIEINKARNNYSVIKDIKTGIREKTAELIKADLKSDDFETFYKYHKMKDRGVNIEKTKLSQTEWFREQIEKIIKK